MACFIVPAAEAALAAAAKKGAKNAEEKKAEEKKEVSEMRIPLSSKLRWLTYLLSGGAVLLAFEHIWHGEVTPWFPFLTAMKDPSDAMEMFHEMATVGVGMALMITAVWAVICVVADLIVKREPVGSVKKNIM